MISSLAISRSVYGIKCYNKLSQPLYSVKYVNQSNYNETLNNPEDEPELSVGIGLEPPIPEPAILVSVIIITVAALTVLMYSRRGIIKL